MTEKWFEHVGEETDIAVSTRVRLARNIDNTPFPARQDGSAAAETAALLKAPVLENPVTAGQFSEISISKINALERLSLVERHLISPAFAKSDAGVLLLSRDEGIAVMLNEEDHMRLQVLGAGFCPEKCLETAVRLDRMIEEGLTSRGAKYAFDENWGYLTRCPTNLGTGMRVSVMLHLPALASGGKVAALTGALGKMGIAVRGFYGEGSREFGELYQVSNQLTLGSTEEELVSRMRDVCSRVIGEERNARNEMLASSREQLEDKVYRAEGLLKSARVLTASEAMQLLSDARLGMSLGLIKGGMKDINAMLSDILPATLTIKAREPLSPERRDVKRAAVLREIFN